MPKAPRPPRRGPARPSARADRASHDGGARTSSRTERGSNEGQARPPRTERGSKESSARPPARAERGSKEGAARPPRTERGAKEGTSRPATRAERGFKEGGAPRPPRPNARPQSRTQTARAPRLAAEALAPTPDKAERIPKLLSRAGVASRRDIEKMITDGRVRYKGEIIQQPAPMLRTLEDVTVDGHPVSAARATRLFLFHKPAGCLTTARDPKGRPTIFDLLPKDLPRLLTVGRLDMNTEGLLLLTNDGALKRALELPANAVERQYRVRAHGTITQHMLEALATGISVEGVHYGPILADIERRTGANVWLAMRLKEGKNREIRNVLEYLGLQVTRLIRVSYGQYHLADLPTRGVVEVDEAAVQRLLSQFRLHG